MTDFLKRPVVLWCLFGLFVLETLGFAVIMAIWDFGVIDEMSDPDAIRQHIAEMTALQRSVHAWTTATLDVAYPLTYGPLFAGLILRAFDARIALPAILVIPTDLAEGVVQVIALTGNLDVLWLKAWLTPAKLGFFILAMVIALVALVIDVRRNRKVGKG